MKTQREDAFYTKGLQFECMNCGWCCTGFPGYVYLSEHDIKRASEFLHISEGKFVETQTRVVTVFHERRLSLLERENYSCIFWNKCCTIYPSRPYQCRAFPFWERHLVSRREWEKTASLCRGVNRGRLYSIEEIERCVREVPDYNMDRFSLSIR